MKGGGGGGWGGSQTSSVNAKVKSMRDEFLNMKDVILKHLQGENEMGMFILPVKILLVK